MDPLNLDGKDGFERGFSADQEVRSVQNVKKKYD